jgi:small conductance mechanosensitive channel
VFTPEQFELLMEAALQKAPSVALGLVGALLILLVGIFVSRWAARLVQRAGERLPVNDRTLFTFLEKVARVTVLAIAGVAALAQIGVPITSFVALMGAIGLGVGLALKDTLSDLAAGLVLLVLRPFGVGDGVEIDSTEGTVKEIGLFAVRLLAWDGVMVTVPNSRVWANRMKNLVVHGTRRVDIPVGVAYGVDLKHATQVLVQAVSADERVKADPAPVVLVQSFGDNAVTLVVRFWVNSDDLLQVRSDMTLAVKVALEEGEIPIPFPQREIRLVAS